VPDHKKGEVEAAPSAEALAVEASVPPVVVDVPAWVVAVGAEVEAGAVADRQIRVTSECKRHLQ
jgi:hypothetical protein